MQLEFRELLPEDAAWAAPLMTASGRMGCEYSYTTAYMWSRFYDVRIARAGDALLLRSDSGATPSFLMPIGVPLEDGVELLRAYTAKQGVPLKLHGIDEETCERLCAVYPDRVRFDTNDGDYDYIYETEALATLPGKAYHSKKNHISAFSRKYDWQYETLNDSNLDEVVALSREWCREKGDCEDAGLQSERCAIRRLLQYREQLSVVGGLIRVDGKAVAFTLGSPINKSVFDVHVEKALSAYAGAYAVINREFAKTLTEYRYLNRENDMGIEGLRRAKQSYRPAIVLKKYTCEWL
ncbi:MAG: DUF2156 domain-containing protein [Clostridia bacterium]|nr:DUF2156 domain-containing protein [Clostridia bacterium]